MQQSRGLEKPGIRMNKKQLEARRIRMDERMKDPKYRRVSYWKELEDTVV